MMDILNCDDPCDNIIVMNDAIAWYYDNESTTVVDIVYTDKEWRVTSIVIYTDLSKETYRTSKTFALSKNMRQLIYNMYYNQI